MGMMRKLPSCPTAQNPRSLNRPGVDRPFEDGSTALRHGLAAMEGTVLRAPCIPFSRRHGFWRSSVTGLGPPLSSCSQASGGRLPPCGARFASDALDLAHLLGESIALRARVRARAQTRSQPCTRPVHAARLHRSRATRPSRRRSRLSTSRISRHCKQAKQATWDVSTT